MLLGYWKCKLMNAKQMFAGRKYNRRETVTQGDIVIPLSEIDWHNGFELSQFLWEEYTWSYVS